MCSSSSLRVVVLVWDHGLVWGFGVEKESCSDMSGQGDLWFIIVGVYNSK